MIDPICGMTVEPDKAAAKYQYGGQVFYFCCEHCLGKFKTDPEKYAAAAGAKAGSVPHAGGSQISAAIDPVCGMNVEPAKAAGQFDYQGQSYFFCGPH